MSAGLASLDAEAADLSHQTTTSTAVQQGTGVEKTAVDVAVQTDVHLMQQAPAELVTSISAADKSQLHSSSSPAPEHSQQRLVLSVCETVPEPQSRDAGCGPESCDSPSDSASADEVARSSVSSAGQSEHSMGSSSGHRSGSQSNSVRAHMGNRPGTADSHNTATQPQTQTEICMGNREAAPLQHRESVRVSVEQQTMGPAERPAGQCGDGQLLEQKARLKGHAKWSRGLQLPEKLSIASLAKHAGVDRAFMQVRKKDQCVSR